MVAGSRTGDKVTTHDVAPATDLIMTIDPVDVEREEEEEDGLGDEMSTSLQSFFNAPGAFLPSTGRRTGPSLSASGSWDLSKIVNSASTAEQQRKQAALKRGEMVSARTSVDSKIAKRVNAARMRKAMQADDEQESDAEEDSDNDADDVDSEEVEDDETDEVDASPGDDPMDDAPSTENDKKRVLRASKKAEKGAKKSFVDLSLSRPLLKAVNSLEFKEPTPIQAAVVPVALQGHDLLASAQTGSGKTAAFMLPTLERLLFRSRAVPATRVMVVLPTRELAAQCHAMSEKLAQFTDIRFALVVGGLPLRVQEAALRAQPDVVIATPGRMIDLLRNSASIGLEDLEVLIMDEADRLLDEGFKDELNELVSLCPRNRQTMLFSATLTDDVLSLAKLSLNNPQRIAVDSTTQVADRLVQEFIRLRPHRESDKTAIVLSLASRSFREGVIIFCKEKKTAHQLKIVFGLNGLNAGELHGNLSQIQRLESLDAFRRQDVQYLICTDVAARGLDIVGVKTVINYDMPVNSTRYIHRVGRTARAGRNGRSISLLCEADRKLMKEILKLGHGEILKRNVPISAIEHWNNIVDAQAKEVEDILKEEDTERELLTAEMEITKAQNLIEHKNEIQSRPARTWFQTAAQKREAQARSKQSMATADDDEAEVAPKAKGRKGKAEDAFAGMTRKKRRRLQLEQMAARQEGQTSGDRRKQLDSVQKMAKKSKSMQADRAKRQEQDRKQKLEKKKRKRAERAEASEDVDDGEDAAEKRPRKQNNMQKGKSAFKSKKKFKRRK